MRIWVKHRLEAEFEGFMSHYCWFCCSYFSHAPSLAGHTDLAYPDWLNTQPSGLFLSWACSTTGHIHRCNYSSAHSPLTVMLILFVPLCTFLKLPTAWPLLLQTSTHEASSPTACWSIYIVNRFPCNMLQQHGTQCNSHL